VTKRQNKLKKNKRIGEKKNSFECNRKHDEGRWEGGRRRRG
jgi:hypothetical protein